jgi:hypothetical protein
MRFAERRARVTFHRWTPALLAAALLGACSQDDPDTAHSFTVEVIDGVRTETTRGGPRFTAELFRYEETLRLTSDAENPDSYMIRPGSIETDSAGNFYVLDSSDNCIVVFDSAGEFVRRIGRAGDGPGDLRWPRNLRVQGDTLHVDSHVESWRLTRYTTDGRLVDTITHSFAMSSNIVPSLYRAPSGELLIRVMDRPVEGDTEYTEAWMTVLSATADTIATVRTPRIVGAKMVSVSLPGGRSTGISLRLQYAGYPAAGYDPHLGIYVTTGEMPWIDFHDLSGRRLRRILIDIPPDPVTERDRRIYVDGLEADLWAERRSDRPNPFSVARLEAEISDPQFPEHRAYWTRMEADDEGWLWLRKVTVPDSVGAQAPIQYRVVDAHGVYLGDTEWPPLVTGHVRRGLLLGIQVDPDTDERIPVVFTVTPAVSGFSYP